MCRFPLCLLLINLLISSYALAEETSPITTEKTRRDDSDSDSSDNEESTSSPESGPATINYPSLRMPAFNFPAAMSHPHFAPPPMPMPMSMYAQIPAPPPVLMHAPHHAHHHHHHPFHMVPAASSYTAFYRPLPHPMPHPMMTTARMSLHAMHPLSPPFLPPPPHAPRTLLPVMVPIKRWDQSSILDSLLNSESGLGNSFLDEPLVFDEEELLAARRHISSPPPPPVHRRDSFAGHRHKSREWDGYEPIPSENRFHERADRHGLKSERREYVEHYDRDHDVHARNSQRASGLRHEMLVPPPPPPTSPSFDRYDDHTARDREDVHPAVDEQHMPPPAGLHDYHSDP